MEQKHSLEQTLKELQALQDQMQSKVAQLCQTVNQTAPTSPAEPTPADEAQVLVCTVGRYEGSAVAGLFFETGEIYALRSEWMKMWERSWNDRTGPTSASTREDMWIRTRMYFPKEKKETTALIRPSGLMRLLIWFPQTTQVLIATRYEITPGHCSIVADIKLEDLPRVLGLEVPQQKPAAPDAYQSRYTLDRHLQALRVMTESPKALERAVEVLLAHGYLD